MNPPDSTFTDLQNTTFFNQLILAPIATRARLTNEGVTAAVDLFHYDDKMIGELVKNLRKPTGGAEGEDGVIVAIPAVEVSAITVDRLKKFAKAVRWFADVGRPITPETLTIPVAVVIDQAMAALKDRKPNAA